MDNSEIIIYIIVIAVVFISALAKKSVINNNPEQSNNTTNNNLKENDTPLSEQYNWRDSRTENTEISAEDEEYYNKPEQITPKTSLPLNSAEELRKAIIVSEILKRKF